MRFTTRQYAVARERLLDATLQLDPDGQCCAICHDTGHAAFECGWNPLLAIVMCRDIAKHAEVLHEKLHTLCKCEEIDDEADPPTAIRCPVCDPGPIADVHEFLHYLAGHETHMANQVGPARIKPLEEPE